MATVRPYLVANREMTTDRKSSSSQSREARLNTKAFVIRYGTVQYSYEYCTVPLYRYEYCNFFNLMHF